ncbi:D-lactate dehydrogenase [Flavobacterium fryxellicola]|uniref:D-lactate dehydrogenase (cytochrome) n=1 Tax=Flavobacterium fryxellicola TaxID=249352 RepID=A0A167U7T7_9FLAO|nr:FAD-binding and (Fe-S)-binding domain-containing protein [Flavobacterium fryxellicola]OAB25340.1 4Fe-4S ferredoxin [Flavobacterium fryxellicola]SHN75028.1 D-lactate dehydrogenase [Flavobacterium fryxellicola]
MLSGKYKILYNKFTRVIDANRVFIDELSTLAYGTDASFYRLLPKIVVKAQDENEVSFLLKECADLLIPVTFRAAGTSLSGQAITDSVLIIAGYHWKNFKILDDGKQIRLQPGLIGARVNGLLAKYNRKIGPDPASINTAMIGGIAANNASGMCCGTAQNSYNTLSSMRIIFWDGTLLDTGCSASKEAFSKSHALFLQDLLLIVKDVRSNQELCQRIESKFKIKNTTGYSLNALIDFKDPFEIIQHLMIGSEGTLGFISEITYHTVIDLKNKAVALVIFNSVENACNVVSVLKNIVVSAVELIDYAGLKSVKDKDGMPQALQNLPITACALLIDTRANSEDHLNNQILEIIKVVPKELLLFPIVFTTNASEYALLWEIRKGLFPSIGAIRKMGTSVIIEDVAFPLENLAVATIVLQDLLKKWGYNEAVIFGHALEGNIHFVFTQNFDVPSEIERYSGFMDEVANIVVKQFNGSLKAEHGTGRNMAPYVLLEWGEQAYDLMYRIKKLFDPYTILNPEVILSKDSGIHLKNLKPIPQADPIIDKCTECGFCEPNCVSADFTLSPRQRIVAFREISRLSTFKQGKKQKEILLKQYQYSGKDTCATDGLCAVSCPVNIDTGKLIKNLRTAEFNSNAKIARYVAANFSFVLIVVSKLLAMANFFQKVLGNPNMLAVSTAFRKVSIKKLPQWNQFLPNGAEALLSNKIKSSESRKVVYFPSCINRTMGLSANDKNEEQLSHKLLKLLNKAGYEVIYPQNVANLCCGMPFLSKGYKDVGNFKIREIEKALYIASENGKLPIITDMSPCLLTLKENNCLGLNLYETVAFIDDFLLPYLTVSPLKDTITVFPVCSIKKMGMTDKLESVAKKCAENVIMTETTCCGFSGDKGFDFPELNQFGLSKLRDDIPGNVTRAYCTSRTCEIGLSLHTGLSYKSIVYLVDEVTKSIK